MSVSRSELKKKVGEILKDADLESTSAKKVRKQLEEDLDTDLTDRKEEVNDIIQEVMDENEEDEEEEEEEEEESGKVSSDYEPEESSPPPKKKAKKSSSSSKKRRDEDSDASFDEDEDDASEEEWGSSKKAKPKAKKPSKSRKRKDSDDDSSDEDFKPSKAKRKSKGGGNTGFTKPLNLSADLAVIVGKDVAPRHEVVKQVWAYIKENKLQDPKNKQFAICDEKLKKVIGETKFKCFGMAKYLKSHMS